MTNQDSTEGSGDAGHSVSELAEAVAEGTAIDWQAVEQAAGPEELPVVQALREVETVLGAHRDVQAEQSPKRQRRPPSLQPGDSWSHLEIRGFLGGGGFGNVYEAFDPKVARATALKLLHAPDASDEALLREAQLLAKVSHPNVVQVYSADRIDARVGISMELLEGHTLSDELDQYGPMSADEAVVIGMKLCDALAEVHRQGIVHRDVKAQNVMRARGGRVVLMDFGIGFDESAGESARPAGTPAYLAPELLNGGKPEFRTDVYALGVLLFHLVTADFPVRGRSMTEFRQHHAEGKVRHLTDVRPGLPDAFVQVVEKALSPDPARRFATAGAFHRALSRAMESSFLARGASRRPKGWRRLVRNALVYGLGWSAIFGGLWWLFSSAPKPEPARILLAPVMDRSGQAVFGESADAALRSEMRSSPLFSPVPEADEIQVSHQMLREDPAAALTPAEAREAAYRTASAAVVGGEILAMPNDWRFQLWLETMDGEGRRIAVEEPLSALTSSALEIAIKESTARLEKAAMGWMKEGGPLRHPAEELLPATTPSLKALRLYTAGVRAYSDGDIEGSESFMRRALQQDQDFALAQLQLGHSVAAQGNPEAALRAVEKAFELRRRTSSDHERLSIEGAYYAVVRQYRRAIEAYRQVLGIHGDDPTTLRQLAIAYRELGEIDRTVEFARRGRHSDGDVSINHGFFVYTLATAGLAQEALSEAMEARERQATTPYLLLSEALAYLILDRPADALRASDDLAKTDSTTYKNLASWMEARTQIYAGQLDRAAEILYKDRRTDAVEGTDYLEMRRRYWAARLLWLEGRGDEALHGLDQVDLSMIPAHMTGWRSVAVVQAELGDIESARVVLAGLGGLREEYPSLLADLVTSEVEGAILMAEGRPADAIDVLSAVEAQSDVSSLRALARAYVALGDFQRAVQCDQRLIERRGELIEGEFSGLWVETLVRLARSLERLGRFEEASGYWNEARAHWGDLADRAFGPGGPADVLPAPAE